MAKVPIACPSSNKLNFGYQRSTVLSICWLQTEVIAQRVDCTDFFEALKTSRATRHHSTDSWIENLAKKSFELECWCDKNFRLTLVNKVQLSAFNSELMTLKHLLKGVKHLSKHRRKRSARLRRERTKTNAVGQQKKFSFLLSSAISFISPPKFSLSVLFETISFLANYKKKSQRKIKKSLKIKKNFTRKWIFIKFKLVWKSRA